VAGQSRGHCSGPVGARYSLHVVKLILGHATYQMDTVDSFLGVKRTDREADHTRN
jgi:hypothetical protein